jgi:ketopantoate reductase
MMLEAVAVAKAAGVPDIDDSLADELLDRVKPLGKLYSSMYWDKESGRPMEVEVILGHAVREGKRLGVATPTLDCLYGLAAAVDGRLRKEQESKNA